ncbi:10 kDa heat shock protein, mitochondrial [Saitoella complicata NRRL Y-17804]|nr:10 kDa heat shock protein, mitochondrial [Saitoella complicata NRRL Y-17804]ODQ55383.1 10 kDa heat shock protein, mitochondrial [Saitoella complicata NRRL Y-17804]
MSSVATRNVKSIVPLLDRVLVQRVKASVKTASGLFLPEKSLEKLSEGTVIAVGKGGFVDGNKVEVSVQAGDRVLLPPFGGSAIKVGEDEYTLFRNHEILAKIDEAA